ncbi:MAG: accessory Sec system translocase SecA2 [Acidobacteria bacterium]|nr:accessory Sec system translocase SecA2 [Acidobacteriota bacterium]
MRKFLASLLAPTSRRDTSELEQINQLRSQYRSLDDAALKSTFEKALSQREWIAVTATAAARVLGQEMFDVQIRGALALARGSIAEMQTGEGKTLAAVPAVVTFARQGLPVHVLTANDYLARRDATWMGDIYRFLGLSVAFLQQGMTQGQRRSAYQSQITYATANEVGFDFLRDQLVLDRDHQVLGAFGAAVVDEVDSLLIDEARIPLVIAGGKAESGSLVHAADSAVRHLQPWQHYVIDGGAHNVALTDSGIHLIESTFGCGNLFESDNLAIHTAVQDALHAHALLRRDVDYIVKNDAVELVDEFKGRIAEDRRLSAGLHAAVEAKEGVSAKSQGMILGSITLQNLMGLYERVCGMTGTAATQALEFKKVYGMEVETIPTNRPLIRVDHPDRIFANKAEKERAVLAEIRRIQATGQPILVGTASVAESERISSLLADIPHHVLNARNDEQEAAIIAKAGERGAVTISTNMAGRGTDIRLGDGVAELGGLYVIGTNKHESRRIDYQLRGRAGRQGDPGCSRFFVSLEDDLITKYPDFNPAFRNNLDTVQSLVEGQHLDIRIFLHGYEVAIEGQRERIQSYRQQVLNGTVECASERDRLIMLRTIDDLWADHLWRVADFKSGVHWLSWGRLDPHFEYLRQVDEWFREMESELPLEIERRIALADAGALPDPWERGAVWTYLTKDEPFGTFTERIIRGLRRKFAEKHGAA